MHIKDRRAFLQLLTAAGAGMLAPAMLRAQQGMEQFYDLPTFGNVSFMHITDLQSAWKPLYYREPAEQAALESANANPPSVTGDALLQYYNLMIGSAQAYAFSSVDYEASAADYGPLGGIAHLASLIDIVKRSRKQAWLLDGGNGNLQSSAPWAAADKAITLHDTLGINLALPTQATIRAAIRTAVPAAHASDTPPSDGGVSAAAADQVGHVSSIAHNVFGPAHDKPLFAPYKLQKQNGVVVAVIGQAAHNEGFAKDNCDTNAGPGAKTDVNRPAAIPLDEQGLQRIVNDVRKQGAQAVLLLSRAGVNADIQLAARVTGIDVILGGRSATPLPEPILVPNKKGKTAVTNAGAQGRFLAVLDLDIRKNGLVDFRYNLLPVVAGFVQADSRMEKRLSAAYATADHNLSEKIAVTQGMLYRRGTFNGTWDELLLQAMLQQSGAQIALYPGYRWGPTLLAGVAITREDMINQLALGDTHMCSGILSGSQIHELLENAAAALFNTDAYERSEQDMMRTAGLRYRINPEQAPDKRITDVMVGSQPLVADEQYKVATWGVSLPSESAQVKAAHGVTEGEATTQSSDLESKEAAPVSGAATEGEAKAEVQEMPASTPPAMLDVVESYLRQKKIIPVMTPYLPEIIRK
ncbi:bifunctional metallophosphatase/5'-nucleotidase [Advenella mimigardefordensis]|nr:5'-nucleotidase C-terminal domain-containing protein [Advenella mimigardefordensis]